MSRIFRIIYKVMVFFQLELGLSVLDSLGRSADFVRWTHLQKQEIKRIGGGSPVASLMPKSVISEGREDQLLVISILKLSGWSTNLVFNQLKKYSRSLNCYKDIYP